MSDILKHLEGARSVIISGHTRPDGDCVGACTGMAGFIREYYPDKKVDVRLETVPASYRSIPGAESVITDFEDDTRYDRRWQGSAWWACPFYPYHKVRSQSC